MNSLASQTILLYHHNPLSKQNGVFTCRLSYHIQVGYPGPHVIPAMPSGGYSPQAGVLDPQEAWNHHRPGDVPMWSPNMEVRESSTKIYMYTLLTM